MKVKLISDLHMESYYYKYEWHGEDLVLLGGDIHTKGRHSQLLNQIPSNVKIILIAGNHSFYDSDFDETHQTLKLLEKYYPNFHYLNNESIDIGNLSFYGGTMWTDFNLFGYNDAPYVIQDSTRSIADFMYITRSGRLWNVNDVIEQYELFNRGFDYWVKNTNKKTRVCLSHFLPSIKCIDKKFNGSILNGYFASNQDNRVDLVDCWFFGHTHACVDIKSNDTRLVCNPRGYQGGLENPNFNPSLIMEIE